MAQLTMQISHGAPEHGRTLPDEVNYNTLVAGACVRTCTDTSCGGCEEELAVGVVSRGFLGSARGGFSVEA